MQALYLALSVSFSRLLQQSTPPSDLEVFIYQLTTLSCWVALGALIVLLVLGLRDQVVIFFDTRDVLWSLVPFASLLLGAAILITLTPSESTTTSQPSLLRNLLPSLVGLLSLAGALGGTVMTFRNAIQYNRSVPIGIAVGLLKLSISILMAMLVINQLLKLPRTSSFWSFVKALFLLGVLGWLWVRLVNGRRVYLRKGWAIPVSGEVVN